MRIILILLLLACGVFWAETGRAQGITDIGADIDLQHIPDPNTHAQDWTLPPEAFLDCTAEQRAAILGGPLDTPAVIDCSLDLDVNTVLRRALLFRGGQSDGVELNCRGGAINPETKRSAPAIKIESADNDGETIPVRNITIRNCRIFGQIRVSPILPPRSERVKGAAIYVPLVRAAAPRAIRLENLTIRNSYMENTIYLDSGVTGFALRDSVIVHEADGLPLYLDSESSFNRIENNQFHSRSLNGREIIAIDGSSRNTITRNWFSGVNNGGIYLYRNCGEPFGTPKCNHPSLATRFKGTIRYTSPSFNEISDNIFYYRRYSGSNPGIFVGSREGDACYCCHDREWAENSDDPSIEWGSSADDRDFARNNVITGNRVCNRDPDDIIRLSSEPTSQPNTVVGNSRISCPTSSPLPR